MWSAAGANPNVIDGEGNSPLLLACRHGHHQVALLLLMHGARVDFATENGDCPLNVALASRSTPSAMVTMLVQFGADPNCSASRAVSNNPAPVMRFASEEHKVAAEQGVVYRKTISRVLMDMLSEWTVELPPVEVVQLIREYIPGSELPNRFFIQE